MNNHPNPESLLGGLTLAEFLRDYWQKKPLLIRNAWPGFEAPVTPDELAGLACDDDVHARLVLERDGEHPWEVRNGPFDEAMFASLPPTHWTLLVQNVERLVPEAADVLDHFRFIPDWRIDDLMISYAPPQGGIGAHLDEYDVFLLQGLGRRRWEISMAGYSMDDFTPGLDLNILKEFTPEQSWVLEPGDMLYLPPGIAHRGTAEDDCLTLSIGFRAPSRFDLLGNFTDDFLLSGQDRRLTDPNIAPVHHSSELSSQHLRHLRELLREAMTDDDKLDEWLGAELTRVTEPLPEPRDPAMDLAGFWQACDQRNVIYRNLDCRLLFHRDANGHGWLFANGESLRLNPEATAEIHLLTEAREVDLQTLREADNAEALFAVLLDLFNRGLFDFDGF